MMYRRNGMASRHGFLSPSETEASSCFMACMNMPGSAPQCPAEKYAAELWYACAGPLVSVPKVGQLVWYFPQGHMEQVAASTYSTTDQQVPQFYKLPSQILCRVMQLSLSAEPETDDVYAQLNLLPESDNSSIPNSSVDEQPESGVQGRVRVFTKILTASDTSTHGGFSVHRKHAEECLPPLDMSQETPSQDLVAIDLHAQEWKFRHTYRGQPRRHLLTTGWSYFVSQKKLVAGDAVIFLRGENDGLRVGIRRAKRLNSQSSKVLSNDSMHMAVVATASYAVQTMTMFAVYYRPRLTPSSFIVPVDKLTKCLAKELSAGMRFKVKYENEDGSERSFAGTIRGVDDVDPSSWPNSKWRSVRVNWDDITKTGREDRVSPWDLELIISPLPSPLSTDKSRRVRPSSQLETIMGNPLKAALVEPMLNPGVLQGQRIDDIGNRGLLGLHSLGNNIPYENGDCNIKMNDMVASTETWTVQREGRSKEAYVGVPSIGMGIDASHSVEPQERVHNIVSLPMESWIVHQDGRQRDIYAGIQITATQADGSGATGGNGQFFSSFVNSWSNTGSGPSRAAQKPSLGTVSEVAQSSQLQLLPSSFNTAVMHHLPQSSPTAYTPSSNASQNLMDYWPYNTQDRLDKSAREGGCKIFGVCLKEPKLGMSSEFKTPWEHLIQHKMGQENQSQDLTHDNTIDKSMPQSSCKLFGFSLPSTPAAVKSCKCGNTSKGEISHIKPSVEDHAPPIDPLEVPLVAVKAEASAEVEKSENSAQKILNSGRQSTTLSLSRSRTKVIMKKSMIGRGVDLSKFDGYEKLMEELEAMFHIEGELSNPAKGWRVAYTDGDGDMMHVGNDPWGEFCNIVRKIYIISADEAEASNGYKAKSSAI